MDIADRLRTAIADLHGRIESLPVAQAMADGAVTRAAYTSLLSELFHVHDALEAALATCRPAVLLYRPDMARRDVIARDLAILGGEIRPPRRATQALAEQFASWRDDGRRLLGALYVFEGSRMGSMVLARSLAQAFQAPLAPSHGLDYHLDGLTERPRAWKQFKATLNALPLDAAEADAVVAGAVASMAGLCDVYAGAPVAAPPPPAASPAPAYEAVS